MTPEQITRIMVPSFNWAEVILLSILTVGFGVVAYVYRGLIEYRAEHGSKPMPGWTAAYTWFKLLVACVLIIVPFLVLVSGAAME